MNGDKNSLFLGIVGSLGVAAVTGVIGWTFAHVVNLSDRVANLTSEQISDKEHDILQDKWIDDINKKMEASQKDLRDTLGQVNDSLNKIGARLEGKNGR